MERGTHTGLTSMERTEGKNSAPRLPGGAGILPHDYPQDLAPRLPLGPVPFMTHLNGARRLR